MDSYYSMGDHTLKVPMSLFRKNRDRLIARLRETPDVPAAGAVVLLQGGSEVPFNDTDINHEFRQESFFQWCFGVEEPDCMGAIDVTTGNSILLVPKLPKEYEVWCGKLKTLDDFKARYGVDEIYYNCDVESLMHQLNAKMILTLYGLNSDSNLLSREATYEGIKQSQVNNKILYPVICECRVIKTSEELEVLRYVAKVSSDAHKVVMRNVRHNFTEFQAEALFKHYVYSIGGCRHVSYTCICGSGHNGSYLHYGHAGAPNNKIIKDGDMCLFDMGGNYCGYAADITCSFPANGKFTENQKIVYNAVLNARNAVMSAARPGVNWSDMHLLANKVMLQSLKEGNILRGEIDDMIEAGLNEVFQPHGLGHFLGLDVHDVGGYLPGNPERSAMPGIRRLRTARTLQAGMVLTIEPGCYFINVLLDSALANPEQNKFIVSERLEQFRGSGGVRIEDDVLITEDGVENFTSVPRTVKEIEEWMAEGRNDLQLPQERAATSLSFFNHSS
ncbi:xaa-Pro dipeptidase isoform X2 [Venturia canescens]|nr:xaa-Pro dipeptidase isoform X2 [Venturia canescens]